MPSPKSAGWRQFLAESLSLLLQVSTIFMMYQGLSLMTNSSTPIVCVISESMAPAFHRGDILFLWNYTSSIEVGDIPVVWFDDAPLPMVHRVVQSYWDEETKQ